MEWCARPRRLPALRSRLGGRDAARDSAALATAGATSQPEVEASEAAGEIPEEMIDRRSVGERMMEWLEDARDVGAVTGA